MEKALGAFIFFKNRWREPSTQASLAVICQAIGHTVDTAVINSVLELATIAFGMMGFFFKEAKPLTEV